MKPYFVQFMGQVTGFTFTDDLTGILVKIQRAVEFAIVVRYPKALHVYNELHYKSIQYE